MEEKLRVDVLETAGDKEDISHLANRMFDQNVDSFAEGEAINRDYLHSIYGENMDFLNKEVRLTRTKYYEMREKVEENFIKSKKQEQNKLIILVVIYAVLLIVSISLITIALSYFDVFMDLNVKKYFEVVDGSMLQGTWSAGGFFFTVGWMLLVVSTSFLGAFIYSTIKNVRQYKAKRERSLKLLEENKREQMLLGLYDAGR